MCSRGGYGSGHALLDPLTHDDFRRNPKWIVGYSDIALHSAMVCSGVMSLHANMGGALSMPW